MASSPESEPLKATRTGWEKDVLRREGRKARVRRVGNSAFHLTTER